jgi:hypothetical protein
MGGQLPAPATLQQGRSPNTHWIGDRRLGGSQKQSGHNENETNPWYLTFTFLVPSSCGLSMFKTIYSVFNTRHFINSLNTTCFGLNWPSSSVKNCLIKIAVILLSHARSSLCLQCACSSLFSCLLVTVLCSQSQSQSQSRLSTNSQSASASWCQAHSWAFDQKFVFVWCFYWKLRSCLLWGALSDERSGLSFVSLV